MTRKLLMLPGFSIALCQPARAQRPEPNPEPVVAPLPAEVTTHQVLDLPGRVLRFTATAGSIRLRDGKQAGLTRMPGGLRLAGVFHGFALKYHI